MAGDAALGTARVSSVYYGAAAGLDYHVQPDLTIGAAMAGGGTSFSLAQGVGSGHSEFGQLGVYGRYDFDAAYVATALSGSAYQVWTTRTGESGVVGTQTASFTAPALSNRTEFGYGFDAGGGLRLTPYLANQIQGLFMPSYAESSIATPAASLFYDSHQIYDDRTEVGAGFEQDFAEPGGALKLFGRLAYAHDFTNEGVSDVSFVSIPDSGFTSYSAKIAPNSALATLGAEYSLSGGWSLGGKLDGQFASSSSTVTANVVLRKTW